MSALDARVAAPAPVRGLQAGVHATAMPQPDAGTRGAGRNLDGPSLHDAIASFHSPQVMRLDRRARVVAGAPPVRTP